MGFRAGVALLMAALPAVALPGSALASGPSVTTGQPTSVTTTGAAVAVTVNPNGVDTYYRVDYGPPGGPLSSNTGWQDAGAGSGPVRESVVLSGLTPNTSYGYQAEVFQNDTGASGSGATVTLTTSQVPSGPGNPIVAPQTPPGNGIFSGDCATDAACVSDSNGVRAAQEQLPPMALPSNWSSLTGAEQIFVATDLERVSRKLTPIPNLVNTYDASVQQGVQTDNDPSLDGLPGPAESIWAGGNPTVMGAMYGWLYDDGYQSGNADCTTPTASGCWGHRNAILDNPAGTIGNATEMDAVAGTDAAGRPSYAATFVNNSNPPAQGSVTFTWAQEQRFLVAAPVATPPAVGPPKDGQLWLQRRRFRAVPGAHAPELLPDIARDPRFGTIVSYVDSQAALSTVTVQRCVASHRSGRGHSGARVCTRFAALGSFTHRDVAGTNRFRFTGHLNGHKLKPGTYRMLIVPRGPTGQRGGRLQHTFVIVA